MKPDGMSGSEVVTADHRSSRWRRLLWLLPLGLLGNVAYALLATDRAALFAALDLDARWLALAVLLAVIPLLVNSLRVWRWGRLLYPQLRWVEALRVVLIAEVGAAVTPTVIGGAPLKAAALARAGLGPSGGVALAALGGLEDACFVLVAIPLAALASGLLPQFIATLGPAFANLWSGPGAAVVALAVAVLIAVAIYLATAAGATRLRTQVRDSWRRFQGHLVLIRRQGRRVFLGNLALAAVQWSARLSILTALVCGLGAPLEPLRAAVLQWLCFTCMVLVPTPGAVGGAEAAFMLVFGRELPAAILPLAMAAWRLVTFYGLNTFGLIALLALRERRSQSRAAGGRSALPLPVRC